MGDESFLPYLFFFGGLALLTWMLLRRSWRAQIKTRKQRGKDDYLTRNPRPTSKEWTMSEGPHELTQWQVEMLERTQEFQAIIDTKLLLLEGTLRKIAAAQLSEQQKAEIETTVQESQQLVDEGSPHFAAVSELLCDPAKKLEVFQLADAGHSEEEIAQRLDLDPYAVEVVLRVRET
ncbi:hypothetical protein [Blastopirellula marina]|uniref:DUF2802 domain-containing protein n=1 Tax=Blastopirellula marina TaxID=124 RepID=A0A2S8GQA6_9BACT|nr:hypothetical protein [Blastopirellula marina]PQO46607.1 hypothetical protein C5Y93_09065 [Blastopirellula marina]